MCARFFVTFIGALTARQQSRRRYAANGFAFVPHTCPPDTLASDRGETQPLKRAVSDKANVPHCRDFFTAAKCRIANVSARSTSAGLR
jgi:hypothetical protein